MKKRLTCLFLAIAMLFSVSSVATAVESAEQNPKLLEAYAIETGTYYSYSLLHNNEEWQAIVFIPNDGRDASFAAVSLDGESNDIYMSSIKTTRENNPIGYLKKGFSSLSEAETVNVKSFSSVLEVEPTEGKNSPSPDTRDSVLNDLMAQMRQRYGNETEYIAYRSYIYPGVDVIEVHQDLVYRNHKMGAYSFFGGTALSLVALGFANITGISVPVSILALIVSVSGEFIDGDITLDTWILEADFGRWTTIDGGSYVYTVANKICKHYGINERNNEKPAYLKADNPEIIYLPSLTYYNDYIAQTDEAHELYLEMN